MKIFIYYLLVVNNYIMNKKVIIGLDGVPLTFLKKNLNKDIMPNLKELVKDFGLIRTEPTIPEVSSVSWSSIITGANPGEHSVYGFTDVIMGTYTLKYHNIRWLKKPPFWKKKGKKYIIFNVPATFPAQPLDGVIITGFISPDLRRSVYPPKLLKSLTQINYRVDIDADRARKSPRLLINDLFNLLRIRTGVYRYLWDTLKWDVFMFVITGTDRIGHYLWDAHIDTESDYHDAINQYYMAIDHIIGEILSKLDEEDQIVILSDHGMTLKKGNINLNQILIEGDLLYLDKNQKLNQMNGKSLAFALDDGRIYIHYKNKYPNGPVPQDKREDIQMKIIQALDDVVINGEKPFEKIYTKEEIYSGPYLDNAPDLIVTPKEGYNLLAGFGRKSIYERDHLTGTHNRDSFLIAKNIDIPTKPPTLWNIIRFMGLGG